VLNRPIPRTSEPRELRIKIPPPYRYSDAPEGVYGSVQGQMICAKLRRKPAQHPERSEHLRDA
jgi:hypothetical protein